MATRLKPTRINVDNTPRVGDGASYQNDDNFRWSAGGGDMSYRDFEWVTLTGNSLVIEDISNNITPSSDFTVSAGTVKPGIEYVLRVNTGNTPYTMTLGTGVTNPNSYKTELKPNTVNQFKFIATSTNQLELEGVDSAVVSEINWGEILGTLSNQTDLQNALDNKADAIDLNTKTFYISSTSDLTNAQAAYDWYKAGKEPIIVYNNEAYIRQGSGGHNYVHTHKKTRFSQSGITKVYTPNILLASDASDPDVITSISLTEKDIFEFVEVDANYSTPYTPQNDGDPTSKKYVDDHDTLVSATAPITFYQGELRFDTTNNVLKVHNGTNWETIATGGAISDTAYGSGWDGQTTIAPSQNAVYDKLQSVDTSISTIEGKIPSAATSSNQLADKDYVNDSINSVTAYYITKDAQGNQFATYAELAAATTFYSGGAVRTPTRNDYTIVLDDETHNDEVTRYIYNNGWEYQYTINESPLTQAQLNALNSGITSGKVTSYDSVVSTIATYGNIVTHNTSEFATAAQGALADTALQSGDNVSELNNDAGYLGSGDLKTINGNSIVGSGDIEIDELPSGGTVGQVLTKTSTGADWEDPSGGITNDTTGTTTTVAKIWAGTEAEYNALSTKTEDTIYYTF